MPNRGFLRRQPRIDILLPDIHGATHDDQQIKIIGVRNCLAGIELDHMPLVAPFQPEVAKYARMFNRNVLKNQNSHSASNDYKAATKNVPIKAEGRLGRRTPTTTVKGQ
jgi:hypothetical protein